MMDVLDSVGPQATHILGLWRLTLAICTIVFVAVLVATALALRRAPRADRATRGDASRIEADEPLSRRGVLWGTVLSVLLLFVLIAASVATDRALARSSLRGALHIEVTGHQWWWELRYDDAEPSRIFTTANELHLPVGRPVILTLRSSDVIHSVWFPNIAGKKDLVPGRDTTHLLRVDREGVYRGPCAEFCGAQHARMVLELVAEAPERYEQWATLQRRGAPDSSDPEFTRGRELFVRGTCAMCHAIRGTDAGARQAPDLTHVGGRRHIAAGALPNTGDALAQWIADPQRFKPGVNMPSHALSADDLQALVTYLESLQCPPTAVPPPSTARGATQKAGSAGSARSTTRRSPSASSSPPSAFSSPAACWRR
jgi:cytochrome c oxidase subunit 2